MIFDWVIGPVLNLLTSIFSALPTGGLGLSGAVGGNGAWSAGALATQVSGYLHQASYFLPVDLMVTLLYITFFGLLPAVMVYEVAQWGYRELPDLFGFGPS